MQYIITKEDITRLAHELTAQRCYDESIIINKLGNETPEGMPYVLTYTNEAEIIFDKYIEKINKCFEL